ncbi:GFA family protein [Acinetobacter baumannii]|uniref:GFA family protein n=1 Tax=Acinetobacter baumannii TaxID=470 RepID=UPI000DE67ED9|nr:GFA family protein [Acinetobacter baumannii]MDR9623160.1 GFA family protein [Acinetobacter baumannii]MDV7383860.1 GFA family protein [Acinetobacter baumannii]NDW79978.1 GFA family protein [Acinetobacter baumannii]NDW96204.1 GFA family protein [Acinetobacter baumannii]QCP22373.1 GFA family protein [Acinetobacter baumannii]
MNGQCLCGETTFEVELKNHDVHVCHCSMCRRQTSGVIMTVDVVKDSLKFIQQKHLSVFNSSEWGERGFCNACGTIIFWRTKDQSYCNINVFSLNEPVKDLKLDMEIFIDSKPDFYNFQNDTKKLTEAEVAALFNLE